jgi:hypothetical protein
VLALSRMPLDEAALADIAATLSAMPQTIAGLPCRSHILARSLLGRDERLMQAESPEVFANYRLDSAGAGQALFLVRPDGYIAYRSDRIDGAKLQAFIRRFEAATAPSAETASRATL